MARTYSPVHADISAAERLGVIRSGGPLDLGEYRIVRSRVFNREVFFAVRNAMDTIQQHHLQGAFYETEELDIIARYFRRGTVFVDIGANVGNHALFVALFLQPERIVAVEPNPIAYENLLTNVALNRVESLFELSWLGYGVAPEAADGYGVTHWVHNLGGARMTPLEDGTISLRPGDEMLAEVDVGFIKIDVEGMELGVLQSLSATIARDRPMIFIEVDKQNEQGVSEWIAAHDYRVAERFKRYRSNENLMLCPVNSQED